MMKIGQTLNVIASGEGKSIFWSERMNERIRELAEQAGDDWDHTLPSDREFLNKFAELIVQECINAVYDDGQDAEYYQDRIKRRFGVE